MVNKLETTILFGGCPIYIDFAHHHDVFMGSGSEI